ncbi:MAG: hypothetical protein IJY62_05295 [Clostridia bacterium]|nr:hypothetical protein [Clostridia bacterium]
MKKLFEKPEMKIIKLLSEDVITASGASDVYQDNELPIVPIPQINDQL